MSSRQLPEPDPTPEMIRDDARVKAAMHGVQSAVKFLLERDPGNGVYEGECSPKHLRVGVNSALLTNGALTELLFEKGIITRAEMLAKLAEVWERELLGYRQKIAEFLEVSVENVHLA